VGPLIELNALRAATFLSALTASLGALLLAGLASPKSDPSPGSAMLIFLTLGLLIWLSWAMLNWFLSLASVFVAADGASSLSALSAAVNLLRQRTGAIVAASVWFGLAHGVAYAVASSAIAFPLALVGVLPGGVVFGGVILTSLGYFAVADYLYVGRLAAYMFIVENSRVAATQILPASPDPPTSIDPSELILSDLPLGQAPA
jgi:hypothetical protein